MNREQDKTNVVYLKGPIVGFHWKVSSDFLTNFGLLIGD